MNEEKRPLQYVFDESKLDAVAFAYLHPEDCWMCQVVKYVDVPRD